ncbi:hypothetical protein [Streptomyces sp. NPDC000994]
MTASDGNLAEPLTAAFHAAYTPVQLDAAESRFARLLAHLRGSGCKNIFDVSADVLNAWIAQVPKSSASVLATLIRRVLRQLDPAELHPSLLVEGAFHWSPHRSPTAVTLARGGQLTSIDPAAYPQVRQVADALTGMMLQLPTGFSASRVRAFAGALRSLLGWLDALPAPPRRLEWLTADLLDCWVDHLKANQPNYAQMHGARVRDLLANRLTGLRLHGSLVGADGATFTWQPAAAQRKPSSEDLPFSTVAAVRDAASRDVRHAVARISTATRLAATGTDPGDDLGAWEEKANVWRAALDGNLNARRLEAALGHDPGLWPGWLRALLPQSRPGNRQWPVLAVEAVHATVFPTALEVTAGYVLMLLATGLPPESVMALEASWFLTSIRPNGGYGSFCRVRYPKDRAVSQRDMLIYTTRTPDSPVRVRDQVLRFTAGLRNFVEGSADAGRLWIVARPMPLRLGAQVAVTTLAQIHIALPGVSAGSANPFPAWLAHRGIRDPEHVARWNAQRAERHEARASRRRERLAAHGPLPGLLDAEPFRPYSAWPGEARPQRLRKTIRIRDIVLHGPHGAARDHTTATLLAHYTASEVLRVVAATAVRDAQAGLAAFAAAPEPRLITAPEDEDLTTLATLLAIPESELRALLTDGSRLMRNGLVCTTPTSPPSPHTIADDGMCTQTGSVVCRTCPAAIAAPTGTPALWDQIRSLQRTAHVRVDNQSVATAEERTRMLLLQLLEILDPAGFAAWTATGQPPQPPSVSDAPSPPRRRRRP